MMDIKPLTSLSCCYLDKCNNELGRFFQIHPLNNLGPKTALAQAIPYVLSELPTIETDLVGFNLRYSRFGSLPKDHRFYFALCADDVLSPKAGLSLAARLQKTPGNDLFSRDSRRLGKDLETIINDPESEMSKVFILQSSNPGQLYDYRLVSVKAGDTVLNRETGEIYFPFPATPKQKPAAPKAQNIDP